MTSPPQNIQRRVEALLPGRPELAQVRVDFSRYPIPDIRYLTVVKWALSREQDWPLLAEKRPPSVVAARSATFGLAEDELRRVVYDDLKRSLWRPTPGGLTLDWDDRDLQVTLTWSPAQLQPDARPVFAALGGILKPSTVALIEAQSQSAEAFRQAVADARGPTEPPRPAFRVEVGHLTLPAERYPGATHEQRAEQLYETLKQRSQQPGIAADPQVRFTDESLTIHFDTYSTMLRSGLFRAVLDLAHLPQFGEPPTHPGAPPAGSRQFTTVRDGANLRAIEHAFAVPGYRAHRQAARREITAGLTYDVIARSYREYDATFTPERLKHLNGVLEYAAASGDCADAFVALFQHGGFVIGESHHDPDAFEFVREVMPELKAAGMTGIVCETFEQEYQNEIDKFVLGNDDSMGLGLKKYVLIDDQMRDSANFTSNHAVEEFLWEARRNRVPVIAAEHPAAFYSVGAGRITEPQDASKYDREKRLALYNWVAANRDPQSGTDTVPSVDVHITGGGHANTSDYGYPGIAQLAGYPAVTITKSAETGVYFMTLFPEDRSNRLIDVPAHSAVAPTSPSPSRGLATTSVEHNRHVTQERTGTGGMTV